MREREPHVAAVAALWLPATGIVDYVAVCDTLRKLVEGAGGLVRTGAEVVGIDEAAQEVVVSCCDGTQIHALGLINCAGLHCDRIARMAGLEPDVQILPFRGEYFELTPERRYLVKGLVYPVPDPAYPFPGRPPHPRGARWGSCRP